MGKMNLIDNLHEAGMLYFVLVSLFSADTLIDANSCRKSLEALEILKRDFETSTLMNDQELKSMIDGAEEIILRDLYDFEEKENQASGSVQDEKDNDESQKK